MDIFLFRFWLRSGLHIGHIGAQFNTTIDLDFLRNDEVVVTQTKGLAHNVIEMLNLDLETKLKGNLKPVAE